MEKKKLFNPTGITRTTDLLEGNPTNLLRMDNAKYKWATALYKQMRDNFWIPQVISISDDLVDWNRLTSEEQLAYKGIISFLVFLDSLQVANIPNIADYITAPEVSQCLAIHTFQESIHADSYSYLIESLFKSEEEKQDVYEFWRNHELLLDRITYIASIYQNFVDSPNRDNFLDILVANYILEGIYFYNAFNFFYSLEDRQLMKKSASMIRLIHRDELTHHVLFQRILSTIELNTDRVHELFHEAVKQEINWSYNIIGDSILGMSKRTISQYTQYLANECLTKIRQPRLYPEVKNPYIHLEKLADTKGEGNVYTSFFENSSTSYQQESVLNDWNF